MFVIAGLDPAIHPISKDIFGERWMRGSSPRMTTFYAVVVKSGPTD
jgi:hypothetical protein